MANIQLQITNTNGFTTDVDLLEFPFRLNRTVFTTSEDRLKSLGGTYSTQIKLSKSKRNNRLFAGKSEFNDYNKFNNGQEYKAVLVQDGSEIARGTLVLETITFESYEGHFYDQNVDWVNELSNIQLNQVGYVDGVPTWLVPFNGAITFNAVNDLTNKDTDFVCPTIVYNNTPITDYLDLTDEEIWGTFNGSTRLTPAFEVNDFVAKNGFYGARLGHTFDSFPPAVNYKNLIERVFKGINLQIDCQLFNEDWFNAIYLPYVGDEYKYNWKNLATVIASNLQITQVGDANVDETIELIGDDRLGNDNKININYANLPSFGGGSGTVRWIDDYKFRFNKISVLKHDDSNTTVDKITAINPFGLQGQYIAPISGQYTIKLDTDYRSILTDPINIIDGQAIIWSGDSLINSLGTWDVNSQNNDSALDHYGWDDHVLIVRRYNESNDEVYPDTDEMLYRWMNGENTDFIEKPSDVIAYFSPKRKLINDNVTPLAENQYKGSPLTNFENEVVINSSGHYINGTSAPKDSGSLADMEITLDLEKNERVVVYWTSLQNIYGEVAIDSAIPNPYSTAYDDTLSVVNLNVTNTNTFEISYDCGQSDLDLAQNLPNISCKDFISSFVTQFNLYPEFRDGTVILTPQKYYYTDNSYDITDRVQEDTWASSGLPSPKTWNVGYTLDQKDRLLTEDINRCDVTTSGTNNYGNVEFDNENATSNKTLNEWNMFSPTKFVESEVILHDVTSGAGVLIPQSGPDPVTGVVINTGIISPTPFPLGRFVDLQLPSIQSLESFDQKRLGDLTYDYNYAPRLIYHLGTINQYTPLDDNFQVLVDSPRRNVNFILKEKHWTRLTVSQFDQENSDWTGITYPSLRYDRTTRDDGLYIRYFENLIALYNESEMFSINVALRAIDWIMMSGSRKIRYGDQLYRLSEIVGYDPKENNICQINMIKEI